MGVLAAEWLLKDTSRTRKAIVLEVRGVPGNSVDRDRHDGFRQTLEGRRWQLRYHRGDRQLGDRR